MDNFARKPWVCALTLLLAAMLLATPVLAAAEGVLVPSSSPGVQEDMTAPVVPSPQDPFVVVEDNTNKPGDSALGEGGKADAVEGETAVGVTKSVIQVENTGNPDVFDLSAGVSPHYADFSFPSIQSLQGIFTSVGMYVTMPEYTISENATLRVSYT